MLRESGLMAGRVLVTHCGRICIGKRRLYSLVPTRGDAAQRPQTVPLSGYITPPIVDIASEATGGRECDSEVFVRSP